MGEFLRWCIALAWLGLLIIAVALPAIGFCLGVPAAPPLPADWRPPVVTADEAVCNGGRGRRSPVGMLTWVNLAGTPAAIGAAHGALLADRNADLEGDLVDTLIDRVPSFPARHLLLGLVALNNRRLPTFFRPAELDEIRAATAGHTQDRWRCLGPAYQRAIHYHALHDVSQYLIDNPLVRPIQVGCSAFAAGGARTADGHLIAGRLFDFEGGPRFDLDKVVFTVRPAQGLRFVHVAWAGMSGAVTGINEAGLWVSINAAVTAGQGFSGRPIVLAVREALETCRTIDEAAAVFARSPVFVSDAVLLASARERRAAVVELGPTGCALREWDGGLVATTNHFLHPRWSADATNRDRIAHGTTARRLARLDELLSAAPLTPATAIAVLRDRRGPGGEDLGFGNRGTVNAWIGAHLAVADLDRGILWVSEPRHGLGAMRAFTVDGPLPAADLPADPELERCRDDLPRWLAARQELVAGPRDATRRHELAATLLRLNPRHFESHWLAGLAADDVAQRRNHLEQALALRPAYPEDAERIRSALAGADARPGDAPATP